MKNKKTLISIIIIAIAIIIALLIISPKEKYTYKTITMAEAKIEMEYNHDIVLVDVRTEEEYNEINIEGSILIPLNTLKNTAEIKLKNKSALIFVHCKSGKRSKEGAKILADLGYKNVYDIGGLDDF